MKIKKTAEIGKLSSAVCLLCMLTFQTKSQTVVFENDTPSPDAEIGYSVLEAPDNSLIVVGSTTTIPNGNADIKVTKLTSDGTEIWSVTHGGSNNDFPASGLMLSDGSLVIVGTTGSFSNSPSRDVYLLKMDSEGDILWTQAYGGSETDEGTDIKQTPEGDFIITASTESYGEGEMDGWLLKTDSEGNLLWDQTFGGSEMDNLSGVDISPEGGYILTGGTHSFADGNESDLWFIKTDASGNEIWSQTFGEANRIDFGNDAAATLDGYVAVGIYDNNPNNPPPATGEAFFIKVDFDGNLVWNQSISGGFRVEGYSVHPSQDGGWLISGIRVAGSTSAGFWVAKADQSGAMEWEVELGQPASVGTALDVIQTSNGDVVATGFSGFTPSSTQDLHVLRLTDNTLSVTESRESIEFLAMPNPTQGYLEVVLDGNHTGGTLLVCNDAGRVVKSQKFNSSERIELNLSMLPAGMYVLQVNTAEGVGRTKVVKF